MSSFAGSFGEDGYMAYDSGLSSQRFDSFSNIDADSVKDSSGDSSPVFTAHSYAANDDVFSLQQTPEAPLPPPIYASGLGFSAFSPEQNGKGFDGGFGQSNGPILPPPVEMQPEEGFALREWQRLNAIRLGEKEKREKEMLEEIKKEAEQYKAEFYRKHKVTVENNKASNREKEKLFLASQEKFHAEAEKNFWKAIADLIPHEVPAIEKRGKKDKEKNKPSIVVIQGPKPGKPTDLSRMRQILLKLKHNTPPHMKPKPPAQAEPKKDAKSSPSLPAAGVSGPSGSKVAAASTPEAIAVA